MAQTADPPAAARSKPPTLTFDQWGTIVATGLGLFIVFLDALVSNVALPDIQVDFDTGEAGVQWVVTAYSLGMAALIMSSATVADRYGRRRIYVAGLIVFAAASAAAGLAPNIEVLVIARWIQGMAGAAVSVTSLALLSASFPEPAAKARAIGLWSAIASVGTALGPSLGAVLADVSWRLVFFVNVPVGIVAVIITFRFVGESRDPRQRDLDPIGQLLFLLAIGSLAYAVIQGQQDGFGSPLILTLFAVAAVGLVLFVVHELRFRDPMMELRLFRNETYSWAIATVFVVFFAVYGALLLVTQYLQNVRDESALVAGAMMLPLAIAVLVMSPISGRIVGDIGPGRPILAGLASLLVGLLLLAAGAGWGVALVPLGMAVVGLGLAGTITPISSLAMTTVAPDQAGMASGIVSAQRAIGSTIGYAVMGTVLTISLSANLSDDLRSTIPDDATRETVSTQIIDQADPTALPTELGPKQRLTTGLPRERAAIVSVADDAFVAGIQLAFLIAAGLVLLVLIGNGFRLPRGRLEPAAAADGAPEGG